MTSFSRIYTVGVNHEAGPIFSRIEASSNLGAVQSTFRANLEVMNCPRDSHRLDLRREPAQSLWSCGFCSGAFIQGFSISDNLLRASAPLREEWDTEICCPADRTLMKLLRIREVAIDVCRKCLGVWLDPDEVEQLLGYALPEQLSAYRAAWKAKKGSASQDEPWIGVVLDAIVFGLMVPYL